MDGWRVGRGLKTIACLSAELVFVVTFGWNGGLGLLASRLSNMFADGMAEEVCGLIVLIQYHHARTYVVFG